jgi:hypothetical protein
LSSRQTILTDSIQSSPSPNTTHINPLHFIAFLDAVLLPPPHVLSHQPFSRCPEWVAVRELTSPYSSLAASR